MGQNKQPSKVSLCCVIIMSIKLVPLVKICIALWSLMHISLFLGDGEVKQNNLLLAYQGSLSANIYCTSAVSNISTEVFFLVILND